MFGVKRCFRDLQEYRRIERRKKPSTITEAVDWADELFKKGNKSKEQVANNDAPVTQSAAELEVVPLSAHLKKAREEAVGAEVESDALCAAAELATKEYKVASKRCVKNCRKRSRHERR